jgi:hypothetical protein
MRIVAANGSWRRETNHSTVDSYGGGLFDSGFMHGHDLREDSNKGKQMPLSRRVLIDTSRASLVCLLHEQ